MEYWINSGSEVNNIVLLSDVSLMVGSCDEDKISNTKTLIKKEKSSEGIFGTDNYQVIQYSQIRQLLSRSTDFDVEVEYKSNKGEDTQYIEFESVGYFSLTL